MTTDLIRVEYAQNGKSKKTNELGMREMQARAYEARDKQYLLLKAPPASGKSRALMFLSLDKLINQGVRKAIVAVPETSIGASLITRHSPSLDSMPIGKCVPSTICVPLVARAVTAK